MKQKTTYFYYSKRFRIAFLAILCLFTLPCVSQTTEDFEDETVGTKTFTNNGQQFTIVDGSGHIYDIFNATNAGWNGSTSDHKFIDNSDVSATGNGSSFTVKTTDGTDITVKSFYLFVSNVQVNANPTTTLTVTGKKNGGTVYTVNKSSGFSNIVTITPNNGFTLIDLTTEGGSDNSNTAVDEITIQTTNNAEYLALDAFRWDVAPTCTDPDVPTVAATTSPICTGGNTNLNITGSLNDATNWHIYTGSCGGTQIGTTATGTFNVSPTTTTTYYIRGEGGCVTPGSCGTVTVTVNNLDDASFNYSASSYCVNAADPSPTITGLAGGSFSSTAGLSINAGTGAIDVSASTPGTYTVTYTTTGTCPNSSTTSVTINALDDASFNYSAAAYCIDASDPSPTINGLAGGSFSSTAGLSINAGTGAIDVSASTPGTYTVTYTTTGTCPNSSTTSVTINALDDASFNYSAAAYCTDASDPSPTITGLAGGSFSSTAGLSINAGTGAIDVSASTPGTYTVTYTTTGTCPNSSTTSVTINALDDASFNYSAAAYCTDASDPSPTITGLAGGSFSSTAGLSINAGTGAIDVSASTPGTYTVTYTTTGTCPNSSTASITINALDDASFNYSAAAYCVDASNPSPTITGLAGGSFSSTAGLSIASNGTIDVSASTPGTYTVTYTTAGTCPNSSTASVTINALDDASFNYSASAYCVDASDPSPTITGLAGGSFSSTAGLSINAGTGAIDVSASTPGTYTVTYTTAGTCPNSSTASVTINALDDASFNYSAAAYCVDASDPTPNITGLAGGSFSSTAGLSINAGTGAIDVSASTPGTYTVTYTTTGTCPNSSTTSVTINALDDASFNYSAAAYTTEDTDPTPNITGLAGGSFSSTAGLSINAGTGAIDVSASTPGTYTVTYTTSGTCPNSSTFNIEIFYGTYTWTGNVDNNWSNASNWNNNIVPHTGGDITIPNGLMNYPTATSAVTVNSITLNNGASFIAQASVTGSITYNRNLPTTNWYLVSSPVSGETLEDVLANHTFATGTGPNLGLGYYSNVTGPAWLYAQAGQTGTIANGIGISVKLAASGDLTTTGTLNTSNVVTPITTGTRTSFNLLGNPFTSFVNSSTFASTNTSVLTEETLWLWDGTQYTTYNAVSPIELAPGQGFFVEASGNANVTFATSNQSHQTTDTFMRSSESSHPTFELFVDRQNEKKSTKVFYVDGKTTSFDNGYDSKLFSEDTSDLKIYTELITNNEGNKLAIQTLPNSDFETMIIPIGVKAKDGDITFSANALNLPTDIKVFLEDRVNETFTDLSEQDYSITLNESIDGIGQFYIHTTRQVLSNDPTQSLNNVSVYKSSNSTITVAGLQTEKGSLVLYSVVGKKIMNTKFSSNGTTNVSIPNLPTGIYLVEVGSDLGKVSKKIIIE
ncbi:Por secretion system C-terminal sorting domain-containing protein [Tenacibaculum sp. MAR_2009_124]|uniref:T9SS type A sorting domain-containing protein n=1 Tax=Tenacibaculum sp. MAR_2009_124 TaxID=1250059 RepID=UPI00089BE2F2|nr:T9SS type A sorting domain-containing protein [Tenacibaculum sp. MAR_2009_124]SEC85128.1 Por secretion system C-terminal sorting domain-containing protein [Tenacibaculum sp. MAR_2009_124]